MEVWLEHAGLEAASHIRGSTTTRSSLWAKAHFCQDYERAEGNCALGIGAILDKNMDTMDDV